MEGDTKDMGAITLRLNDEEKYAISGYAKIHGMTVSEFARNCMLEKIEDEYDLKVISEYEKQKEEGTLVTRPISEIWEELGL